MLKNKNILIGITGGIAAYKAASLVRLFIKAGANVKVVMTSAATEFITPLTLSVLSRNPVLIEFSSKGEWNNHVELGRWADLMLIAPVTANTLSKMANGICDNLLLATYLSAKCPVYFAPAMDLDMYKHPATINNLKKLKSYGNRIIPPGEGELASGLVGEGRMAEPETIFRIIDTCFSAKGGSSNPGQGLLSGKNILVTAGPTHEAIDPVRFIGNHSSGKMGFAIARELAGKGAKVKLICGPVNLTSDHPNISRIDVTSAEDMYIACMELFPEIDIAVMCAAVADYTPEKIEKRKIKKSSKRKSVQLKLTKDILAELGKIKSKKQLLVGFALETDNELANAKKKLKRKNLDFIVLNSMNDNGAGFNSDTNKIAIINSNNKIKRFELKSKDEVAKDIVDEISSMI